MWSIVASLASSAGGILAMLAVVAGLVGSGALVQHKIDADQVDKLKATYAAEEVAATAAAAAKQKSIDDQALAAATAETAKQQALAATIQQELADVKKHVTVKVIPCIPYGLVRVLDAAILGVTADSLTLPPGKSDDSCSTVDAAALASAIVSNYGKALANAEQLNALVKLLQSQQIVFKEKK